MSPLAIYSKTGKGVQEAAGKTSLLSRGDRAVLAVIDGRASVAELHEKFGKTPESQFFATIEQLEAEGFIRKITAGNSKESAPAKPSGASTAPLDQGTDLDFTSLGAASTPAPRPQVDLAARARAEAERRSKEDAAAGQARQDAEARARAQAEAQARAQAVAKARAEAEARARAEAEAKARTQAEAKARAERDAALRAAAEAKARAEAEAKARAEAEARAKAAREGAVRAALEAKARAEAELNAKLDAERKTREELERKLKEQAEQLAAATQGAGDDSGSKGLSEIEELRQQLEEKRRAREEAERGAAGAGVPASEAAQRIRRETDELRQRLEQDRRAREEAERRAKDDAEHRIKDDAERRIKDDAERRIKDDAERRGREEDERKRKEEALAQAVQAELRSREDAERTRREAEEAAKREADERQWKEQAERMRREQERAQHEAEEEARRKEEERRAKEDEEKRKKFLETQTLFADLSAFSEKEVVARPEIVVPKPEEPSVPEKKPVPPAAAPSAKAEAPAAKAEADDDDLRRDLDALAKAKARRREERRSRSRGERRSGSSKEGRSESERSAAAKPKAPAIDWKKVGEQGQRFARKSGQVAARVATWVYQGARKTALAAGRAFAAFQEFRRARAERLAGQKAKARAEERKATEAPAAAKGAAKATAAPSAPRRQPANWGARLATGIVLALAAGAAAIHFVPLETATYEQALRDATGQPVRIGAAHWSLIQGPELKLERVRIGDGIRIGVLRAAPDLGALVSGELVYGRVELDQAVFAEQQLGALFFGAAKGGALKEGRIVARGAQVEGQVKFPALDAEIVLGADGKLKSGTIRGPDGLHATLKLKGAELALEASADKLAVPFVPGLELIQFTLAGTANRQGLSVSAWDGMARGGVLSGTARLRWTDGWSVEGSIRARAMEAGKFAPALLSEGRGEAQGTYTMRAADVSGLAATARLQGRFSIAKGVLARIDLSRAVQSGGAQAVGRTPFAELSGEGIYDRGAVLIRNARLATGGALNADANLDITPSGTLSGRIVAELSGRAVALRASVALSGTLDNPHAGN